ncbi:histone H3, partial [Zopfia rhizophila CBS 207.26]
ARKNIPSKKYVTPTGSNTPRKNLASKAARKPAQKSARKTIAATASALHEIKYYQRYQKHLLRRLPFQRLVREIIKDSNNDLRVQATALDALQEAAEAFLVNVFEAVNLSAIHAKRVTIQSKDL